MYIRGSLVGKCDLHSYAQYGLCGKETKTNSTEYQTVKTAKENETFLPIILLECVFQKLKNSTTSAQVNEGKGKLRAYFLEQLNIVLLDDNN